MSETFERIDARRRRGTYKITTNSGTSYFIEVRKSVAGAMRVISDGNALKGLREGTVGNCGCHEVEPIIQRGQPMHLSDRGVPIVHTSPVVEIEQVEDGIVDTLLCSRCKRGYKKEGLCHLCHN